MLPEPSVIQAYYTYQYTFLDDLQFIKAPDKVFTYEDPGRLHELVEAVKKRFLDVGWEGDGEIGVLWLPPFVDTGIEDTWGTYIWHVKQNNNGISFLATARPLEFLRLAEQNRPYDEASASPGVPINIIESGVRGLRKDVTHLRSQLITSLQHLRTLSPGQVRDDIVSKLLIHYQGLNIRALTEFLDECYLQFLIEVISGGNRANIKLQKLKVQIDPNRYQPDDDPNEPFDNEGSQWLTVRGLISDIWKSFKFEPYKMKFQMLFGAIDFVVEESTRAELMKHVVLRNCVQHHEGQLDHESLRQCGLSAFVMRRENGTYELKAWEAITFTEEELLHLDDLLVELAAKFSIYVDTRIPTRHYLHGG